MASLSAAQRNIIFKKSDRLTTLRARVSHDVAMAFIREGLRKSTLFKTIDIAKSMDNNTFRIFMQ
jgi:hypothetical protein